tara:strand:- start:131 stop:1417 length:1287 start_codon:yes stop_codon:yes gene_type:complete
MANIAFAKTGLMMKFDFWEKAENFKSADHCKLLINLAYNNPDDNFYIIGLNNLNKININLKDRLFPNNNVFSTIDDLNPKFDLWDRYKKPLEWLNNNQVNLDYGIIGGGPTLNINVPNRIYTKSGNLGRPLGIALRSASGIIHTLNETNIDWISIADDPRCLRTCLAKDLYNNPKVILSQVNSKIKSEHIKSYSDQTLIENEVDVVYSNVEMSCNLDEKIELVDSDWKGRRTSIGIVLNEAGVDEKIDTKKLSNGHRPRYPILKEWLINKFNDICVYGKWHDTIMKSDICFKGFIERSTLYPEMMNWKHSLCVPIDKGWATAKYLEYLKCGVSPFMHPEYDDQNNTNIQEFYRVGSVEDFKDKVAMSDDTHIKEINKGIKNCLSDEYISGQRINDDIYSALGIKRNMKNKVRNLWTPQKYNTLENFME